MTLHADQLVFRQWLVRQLVATRWPTTAAPSLPLAQELGVQLDVLAEAYELRQAVTRSRGKPAHRGGQGVRNDYAMVRVYTPPAVHKDWLQYLKVIRISSGALLRSLVHHFLLDPIRPTTTTPSWHYRGEIYQLKISEGRLSSIPTRITRGAEVALDHHALLWNVSPTSVLRGLVIDLLEGRTKRLKIVGYSELWGDPDRYLHPEKF
jgi:hypothetical protein